MRTWCLLSQPWNVKQLSLLHPWIPAGNRVCEPFIALLELCCSQKHNSSHKMPNLHSYKTHAHTLGTHVLCAHALPTRTVSGDPGVRGIDLTRIWQNSYSSGDRVWVQARYSNVLNVRLPLRVRMWSFFSRPLRRPASSDLMLFLPYLIHF